jgi:hypothetical protein
MQVIFKKVIRSIQFASQSQTYSVESQLYAIKKFAWMRTALRSGMMSLFVIKPVDLYVAQLDLLSLGRCHAPPRLSRRLLSRFGPILTLFQG